MDALIGRLSQIQNKKGTEFLPKDAANPEVEIIKMQAELHNAASTVRPLFGGVFSKPAPLFSLTA